MGRGCVRPRQEPVLIDGPISEEEKQRREAIVKGDMKVEVKNLERRFDEKGNQYIAEQKDLGTIAEKIDWWHMYALCLTHQLDQSNNRVLSTSLQINSSHLKTLLKDVIGNFPGVSFQTKNISLNLPARPLFHYRQEIEDAGKNQGDNDEATAHVDLLLDFIDEQFEETTEDRQNLLEQGLISYSLLWTIFRPGILVYARVLGQPRVFTLLSYQYNTGICPSFQLDVSFVDYDGEQFGTRNTSLRIIEFYGTETVTNFNVYPLEFSPQMAELKSNLTSRGRAFESMAGQTFRRYKGIAVQFGCPVLRHSIEGRVIIDCETFHRMNANNAFEVTSFPGTSADLSSKRRKLGYNQDEAEVDSELMSIRKNLQPLSDEQCLLANATVRGFSFLEKKFLDFFVDKLFPVDWNENCFDQLVLPDAQKDLVRALVATHTSSRTGGFDDIVKGKGKGLILVLHGPPGVGKTLTAECVAEFSKRPLYIVSSGDLGTEAETLDTRLSRIMDMASTWKAVLLIDEADVFLEERSSHDLERNALVSIFLRVLEYYEGIIFLTTNRVSTFDDAFKSRIHVPLKYASLPRASRRRIWVNLLGKVEDRVDVDEEGYEQLSDFELNGRQVKNVVRTAGSLARFNKRTLNLDQLLQVVTIQMQFERDMEAGEGRGGIVTPVSMEK